MSVVIVCFSGCDVINFEINQVVFLHDQKDNVKCKYLENKKAFKMK